MYNTDIEFKLEMLRVDVHEPVTLYNTLYKPVKEQTGVEGYWLDSEGVLIKDSIKLVKISCYDSFYFRLGVQELFKQGEKCILFRNFKNQAVIEYPDGSEVLLAKRLEIVEHSKPTEAFLRQLCSQHGGLTLHTLSDNCYLIEIFKE